MTKTICIRIDTDILEQIRLIAKKDNRSINYIINKIIFDFLKGDE